MLAVAIGWCTGEARDDDEGTEHTDDAHHVAEDRSLVPFGCRLSPRLRESVVKRAGEELLTTVKLPRLEKLLGADDSQRFEKLGTEDVLSAFPAIEREIGDSRVV